MTTTTAPVPSTEASTGASRPSARRRAAVAVAAFLACAIPVTFTVTITAMLVTGTDADHRFHQLTGQGLVLTALWLGALLPLVRAGWRGRRPSTAAGYRHLALVGAGIAASAVAAGRWRASAPRRRRGDRRASCGRPCPSGRGCAAPSPSIPVLPPLALLVGAVLMPYAVDQLALQNAATTGYHSHNPHLFDMAWTVTDHHGAGAARGRRPRGPRPPHLGGRRLHRHRARGPGDGRVGHLVRRRPGPRGSSPSSPRASARSRNRH